MAQATQDIQATKGTKGTQAILKTGGRQYRISEGDVIDVDHIAGAEGSTPTFDQVLLAGDGKTVTVGTPTIEGAAVTGEIVSQYRGAKVVAFKYKRRKGYHRKVGHRQPLSKVKITGITAG